MPSSCAYLVIKQNYALTEEMQDNCCNNIVDEIKPVDRSRVWMRSRLLRRSSRVVRASDEWLERLTVNAKGATVLG